MPSKIAKQNRDGNVQNGEGGGHGFIANTRDVFARKFNLIGFYESSHGQYFYRPQRSCGQGYVFTRVCDSVHRGGSASVRVAMAQGKRNLVLTFSRQGKHREFCFDTGKNFETQGKI